MPSPQVQQANVQQFDEQTRGPVLEPGDAGYDDARTIWNGMIDREPAVIVQPNGAADVITAVDFAREDDLLLSIKGGGHNVAGNAVCDDGLMIDLSPMSEVHVDPDKKTVRVGGGATLGDLDHETQAFGLATVGGFMSETGVAGYTLGGGYGRLARKHGLAIDNLRSVEIVTANGELVTASHDQNEDLFWGVRGSGGNFGVVTQFEFDLHELGPEVLGGQLIYTAEAAEEAVKFARDFQADAPDEVNCIPGFIPMPPEPEIPAHLHGETVCFVSVDYMGPIEEARDVLEPMLEFGEPIADDVGIKRYATLQTQTDELLREGHRNYWKSHYLDKLPDEAVETFVDHATSLESPYALVMLEPYGGAINRVDRDTTAFPHRDALYACFIGPKWEAPEKDDEYIAWAREFYEAMEPYSTDGTYVNYLNEGEEVERAYGANHERLVEVKNEWDPDNLFQMNQNVEPTD